MYRICSPLALHEPFITTSHQILTDALVSVGIELLAFKIASSQYLHCALCYPYFVGVQLRDLSFDWFAVGTQKEVMDVGGIDNKAYNKQ